MQTKGGYDRDFRARALVQASIDGDDEATARKLGISSRSLKRWRADLDKDEELALLVRSKRDLADGDWAADIPMAIRRAVAFLAEAPAYLDRKDPESVHVMAGAMKLLTETTMARRLLDARLARTTPAVGAPDQSGAERSPDEGESQ